MASDSNILTYFSRVKCLSNFHACIKYHKCKRCGWLCKVCKEYSFFLNFVYFQYDEKKFCIKHYISQRDIVHICRNETLELLLYNKKSKMLNSIKLNAIIPKYSDSIAYGNRIFIIGGELKQNASDCVYEIDYKTESLIKKSFHAC